MSQVGQRAGGTSVPSAPGTSPRTTTARPNRKLAVTDSHYLWLLVALEVGAIVGLRKWSRGHHGG